MVWECKTIGTCECGFEENDDDESTLIHSEDFPISRFWKNSPDDPEFKAQDNWHQIVAEYTALELSFETDIFPALQGVARVMQSQRQTGYYAGLWGDSFLLDLSWAYSESHRSAVYRAPSWSWATHVGSVWYNYGRAGRPYSIQASVKSVKTVPVGLDPLGAINYGELCIQGRCVSALDLELKRKPDSTLEGWRLDVTNDDDHDYSQTVLIEILTGKDSIGVFFKKVCIALEPTNESKEAYRRIGLVELRDSRWPLFDKKATVQTLTII